MKSAIIFIKNAKELELAKTSILSNNLVELTVSELNRLDLDKIFLVGGKDLDVDGASNRDSMDEIVNEISEKKGKCLIVSPFYPLLNKADFVKVLNSNDENGAMMLDEEGACIMFMLPNSKIATFDKCNFKTFEIFKNSTNKFKERTDLPTFVDELKVRINIDLIEGGVNIIDPYSTYISKDVSIDKNTTIYPNTYLEGKCSIGKNNVITTGTHLIDVNIGDNCRIESSIIKHSTIKNNVNVGPNAHIRNNSEICSDVRIGNYVEIKNSKIGKGSTIAHLAYVGDATVGKDVNFGCGAITINYDGEKKYTTTIKDHAFIGSNANLIAPITIGEYAMVAAGSTVTDDVDAGDMAISRMYQTNKKGYGFRYINKEK